MGRLSRSTPELSQLVKDQSKNSTNRPVHVVVIGDATIDLYLSDRKLQRQWTHTNAHLMPGGTGLNVAIGLARLGANVTFIGRLSNDIFADMILQIASQEGISLVPRSRSRSKSRVVVINVRSDAERSFLILVTDAADQDLTSAHIPWKIVKRAAGVFVTGAVLRNNPSRMAALDLLRFSNRHGIRTAFDLNIRLIKPPLLPSYRGALRSAFSASEIVLGTREELMAIGNPEPNSRKQMVVTKLGRVGATVWAHAKRQHVEALPVEAIDSTAAGDAFNAAFFYATLIGVPQLEATMIACAAGAFACTVRGSSAAMPTWRNISEVLERRG
jgi:sugar/nucleoside kinase (ribokinase family)